MMNAKIQCPCFYEYLREMLDQRQSYEQLNKLNKADMISVTQNSVSS